MSQHSPAGIFFYKNRENVGSVQSPSAAEDAVFSTRGVRTIFVSLLLVTWQQQVSEREEHGVIKHLQPTNEGAELPELNGGGGAPNCLTRKRAFSDIILASSSL